MRQVEPEFLDKTHQHNMGNRTNFGLADYKLNRARQRDTTHPFIHVQIMLPLVRHYANGEALVDNKNVHIT